MSFVKWNNCQSLFACFENDSLLTLYYFLLILYAAILNSLLTVPKPFLAPEEKPVALHFQCFQQFDFMTMKLVCFSKK